MLDQAQSIDLTLTARSIADVQLPSGAIPWGRGRHWDPWNHIEAAMALSAMGLIAEAGAAYACLQRTQRADGSWCAAYLESEVMDATVDANFCAYVAVGVHHHYLSSGDESFLRGCWAMVRRAVDRVLKMQRADGSIAWAEDPDGALWDGALVTSSSCIYLALSSAIYLTHRVGEPQPDWERARLRLGEALRGRGVFEAKAGFAMDWYYPVLGGAVTGDAALARLSGRWDEFVVGGLGVRCTRDRPWITAGETCELILACCRMEMFEEAARLFDWIQHLRDGSDGLYWTGANHPTGDVYPYEKTTWSAGSVILAADALLKPRGATAQIFAAESAIIDV